MLIRSICAIWGGVRPFEHARVHSSSAYNLLAYSIICDNLPSCAFLMDPDGGLRAQCSMPCGDLGQAVTELQWAASAVVRLPPLIVRHTSHIR